MTDVRLRQVMSGPIVSSSFIPFADHVIAGAWEQHNDHLCVIRQLSTLTGKSHCDLCDEFDALIDYEWRSEGISCEHVLQFCKAKSLPYYCVVGGRLQDHWEPEEPQGKAIAFCFYNNHMYAYKSARCVSQWKPSERKHDETKLRGEPRSRMEPFAEWRQWTGVVRCGTTHCHDRVAVRKQLLTSGRNPRVTMRSTRELSSLSYKLVESIDGRKGRRTFRETPEHAEEIQLWLKKLGDPITYCGQRLPGVTLAVLLQLMTRERRNPKADEKEEILNRQHNQ